MGAASYQHVPNEMQYVAPFNYTYDMNGYQMGSASEQHVVLQSGTPTGKGNGKCNGKGCHDNGRSNPRNIFRTAKAVHASHTKAMANDAIENRLMCTLLMMHTPHATRSMSLVLAVCNHDAPSAHVSLTFACPEYHCLTTRQYATAKHIMSSMRCVAIVLFIWA